MTRSVITPNITASNLPTGSIVQVVRDSPYTHSVASSASYVSLSSTSWTNVGGGHYVEITPQFTTSKILLIMTFPHYTDGNYTFMTVERSIAGGSYTQLTDYNLSLSEESHGLAHTSNHWAFYTLNGYDSPNTTSAVKYQMFYKCNSTNTSYIGWTNGATQHNTCSYVAMEIIG
jgi:hypothetical protein